MADIVDKATRSRMMSGIKGKNTKPEIIVRKALHAAGYRFRLHRKDLPGKPDIVLPKYQAVIFVHGCFWHGHGCHLFRLPSTRTEWWKQKIESNCVRDKIVHAELGSLGWRQAVVWECALKGKLRQSSETVVRQLIEWLENERIDLVVRGKPNDQVDI